MNGVYFKTVFGFSAQLSRRPRQSVVLVVVDVAAAAIVDVDVDSFPQTRR